MMETLDRGRQGHCCHCGQRRQDRDTMDWDVRDWDTRDRGTRDCDTMDWDVRERHIRNWDTRNWETLDQGELIMALDDCIQRRRVR